MASSSTFPIIPITVNKDEDALLEYCKQLTWENSLVKDAKWCNRSWPQVAHFNNLVPHIFHYASPAIRNTYFSALEKYGDFAKYFKTYAPGRRTDIRDDWQTFETWGYELIKAHVYLEDERYSKGIFPEIHSTGPRDYLLVIYPPFFAAAFEVEQQLERKKQLEDNMKVTLMFTRSSSSAAATIAAAATAQNHVATSFYNHYDSVTSPASSITTTSTLPNTTYTTNSNNRRNSSQSNPYARSSISSTSSRDSFIPGTIAADKHEKLCLEIEHMYMDSIPPGHVEDDRKRLVDKIVNMLRRQFPRVKLRVAMFGSSATGLDFADSDLDLCILVPSQYFNMDVYNMFNKQRERNSYYNMFCLSGMLKRAGMINIEAIPRANVPICKFEDPRLQIKADINTHNDMGVENSKLIKEYTFLEPRVRPFLYAIKNFTKRRKINDSTASTLSSYTYVLMGLFYLMTCSPPVIPNLQKLEEDNIICEHLNCRSYMTEPKLSLYRGRPKLFDVSFHDCVTVQNVDDSGISDQLKLYHQTDKIINNTNTRHRTIWRCHNRQTVGDLLVGFFSYYGIVFDYSTTISIRAGTTIPKLSSWRKRHYIAVEDPFIKERNVAVSCSKEGFEHVLNEFRRAHRLLRTNYKKQH
ncbi:hypothetical protein BDA99DRAFT_64456 [Phascolomyces articulosus]|uniref:polynucleotide adenylyltransferase n=1 Tax=Phascolomyces articulosus TaxID=60185 RepID=A0AAD5KDR2_9FUNG|nr:hypothetical protein BDA99DRAFT_64456 [Phascolomyces articulosus]